LNTCSNTIKTTAKTAIYSVFNAKAKNSLVYREQAANWVLFFTLLLVFNGFSPWNSDLKK
jgi:hypothetical protein